MDEVVERAVVRVIETMRENLGEPLTIDDMARTAMFSKFHFTRVFQQVTGLSPGRFLSAMRMQKAKQLLVSTSLKVADISHRVGYNSVGTFSSRFTSTVGLSPTAYRELGGLVPRMPVHNGHQAGAEPAGTIRGALSPVHTDPLGPVFLGLFPDRIPQGWPSSCTILEQSGPFQLDRVPHGDWYLLAHSFVLDRDNGAGEHSGNGGGQAQYVLRHGPIQVHSDAVIALPDLRLRPKRSLDPPVLLAMLDVEAMAAGPDAAALTRLDRSNGRGPR